MKRSTNNMEIDEFEELYLNKAVHCDTEEKAKHFLRLADSFGYKWYSGKRLIKKNEWERYEKGTCYFITDNGLLCGSIHHYNRCGYQIIEYTLPPKFKVGDKVRVNGTSNPTIDGKVGVIEKIDVLSGLPYSVKLDHDEKWFWLLTESNLEKVEEPTYKEETIDFKVSEDFDPVISMNTYQIRCSWTNKQGKERKGYIHTRSDFLKEIIIQGITQYNRIVNTK